MVLQAGKKIYERRVSNMWNWIKSYFFAFVAAVVAVFYSVQAWAIGDIEDIFTAADNWLTTLRGQEKLAKNVIKMIEGIIKSL